MKAIKTITAVGVILSASAFWAQGAEAAASSLTINEQIRAAIAMFQEQKADFLKKQIDEQKSTASKARDEVRDQVIATAKATTIRPLVQELRQSIEEAKRLAVEQNRKLIQEATEAARTRRSN
ncbi:MAG TPA: hypothetical protein VI282_11440 [Verrucomicrobiae bacterium]